MDPTNTSFGGLALKGLDKKKVATNCIDTSTDPNKERIKNKNKTPVLFFFTRQTATILLFQLFMDVKFFADCSL
jgi:hypothetical protein